MKRAAGVIGHTRIAAVPSRAGPDWSEIAYAAVVEAPIGPDVETGSAASASPQQHRPGLAMAPASVFHSGMNARLPVNLSYHHT
jgi:hypothetical protein